MDFHHTGCLVENIETAISDYKKLLGTATEVSKVYDITDQQVKVCFIKLKDGCFLELVAPNPSNKSLSKLLHKKRMSFYHIAFLVDDLDAEIKRLVAVDYTLINTFESEAFEGKRCAFLYNDALHFIELIER